MDTSKLVDELAARVRDALAEAESRASEIVVQAEQRARDLVAQAEADAKRIRERAEAEADERLAKVREALASIEGALGSAPARPSEPEAEVEPGPVTVPEPTPDPVPEPSPPPIPEPTPPAEPEPMPPEPEIEPPAPAQPDREAPEAGANGASAGRSADATAARIVATKMALQGAPREEIAAHLAANYDVDGPEKLLDDVMARAKR